MSIFLLTRRFIVASSIIWKPSPSLTRMGLTIEIEDLEAVASVSALCDLRLIFSFSCCRISPSAGSCVLLVSVWQLIINDSPTYHSKWLFYSELFHWQLGGEKPKSEPWSYLVDFEPHLPAMTVMLFFDVIFLGIRQQLQSFTFSSALRG